MRHVCSVCKESFELEPLPTAFQRVFVSDERHIPFSRYVYATCPNCGHRDWANERRYLGFLGPKGLYALMIVLLSLFLLGVYLVGFKGFP
jgi:hypothetical protein